MFFLKPTIYKNIFATYINLFCLESVLTKKQHIFASYINLFCLESVLTKKQHIFASYINLFCLESVLTKKQHIFATYINLFCLESVLTKKQHRVKGAIPSQHTRSSSAVRFRAWFTSALNQLPIFASLLWK